MVVEVHQNLLSCLGNPHGFLEQPPDGLQRFLEECVGDATGGGVVVNLAEGDGEIVEHGRNLRKDIVGFLKGAHDQL